MDKPNCYECKHRKSVPGDAHSMCGHEKGMGDEDNPFAAMFKQIGDPKALGIEAVPMGVQRGWFRWPANFDPVWLVKCNGFEQKTK